MVLKELIFNIFSFGVQEMQALIPGQATLTLSPGGVKAMQMLFPRQAVLTLPARKEVRQCRCSFPGRMH